MEEKEISSYETVQERGRFVANGYIFDIEPVYFGEELAYFSDVPLSLHLQEQKTDPTSEELAGYIIALFQIKESKEVREALGLLGGIKLKLAKLMKRDYRYYSDNPSAIGLVKWIEKKVKCQGKRVRFYDLERKYKLTKTEIAEMYRYLERLSGF